ncbi:putative bifunctional diguanylate cyclase/phosphodiesterase [Allokutzneria albata]|uniref:PAS domain S-box-containing protein/diguanylate cyclase (GGDEF) domain-containing protein n=1 Tax=Allokutzneria albata TaxID=211114 RepID=A0A1G9V2Q6_ALLAB|nr:EAL domain-containing protein [Allokutzneria albata]SDM66306.1 PAS domain S-box-containing protein/diguanylate cyclase (GGDEF) domain-containing protein [Allokutzneria albata]
MSTPHPEDSRQSATTEVTRESAVSTPVLRLARTWAEAVTASAYTPLTRGEVERLTHELLTLLMAAMDAGEAATGLLDEVAERMVRANFTGPDSLRRSVEVLGEGLLDVLGSGADRLTSRVLALLGGLATSYTKAMRERTLHQQQQITDALLRAKQEAERHLRASEARFREVFTSSGVGIALTDFDGRIVQANPALTEILGYSQQELAGLNLYELFQEEGSDTLRHAYRELAEGERDRFRVRRMLATKDGDAVLAYLAVSALHEMPGHIVTMVEDATEVHMLTQRLRQQSLNDALTGLANRQLFSSRLQTALARMDPQLGVTVLQLDLDGFGVVNAGMGPRVGDQLLQVTGKRLEHVFADENAVVARFGGDEFAVLLENTEDTPYPGKLAVLINTALAEPTYVDGVGVAVSASIGVVRANSQNLRPEEVLRSADITLRRAKAGGKGQWELFDAQHDTEARTRTRLAASIPGAEENGEFEIVYRPVLRLPDHEVTFVEALLRWNHPEQGVLPHERCVELAEETGMILPLGRSMLREACMIAASWPSTADGAAPGLWLNLTPLQARDPDLAATVRMALADCGMSASRLRLGIPMASLRQHRDEAEENAGVLGDMGVVMALHEFEGGLANLGVSGSLNADLVRVAPWVVRRLSTEDGTDVALRNSVRFLIPALGRSGARVVVGEIETVEQLEWWRGVGATFAQGPYFGEPSSADELTEILSGKTA